MEFNSAWFQDHLLAIVAVSITVVLMYHYIVEKENGARLSKKYRNSIYEAQAKIFLNATQFLIRGNKELAIKEFLLAVDLNRDTIDTYFALGGLFRSNGEIEKAISIHRSLIARESISEYHRLRALKELAIDFDKGGFIDKAIDTYKDVLKINRDQYEVIQALCRIYEDIEDWDQAYNYRIMLSKVGHKNQGETISHILVQKAKTYFEKGDFQRAEEDLDDAFRFAPSVSAKILKLKIFLVSGDTSQAQFLLNELLREHPLYASFVFVSLSEPFKTSEEQKIKYKNDLALLKNYFLALNEKELLNNASIILSRVRLLKEAGRSEDAYLILKEWMANNKNPSDVLKAEYIKLLIDLDRKDEALVQTKVMLDNLHQSIAKHFCKQCGFNSDSIFWRCPQCHEWETIQFRWKV